MRFWILNLGQTPIPGLFHSMMLLALGKLAFDLGSLSPRFPRASRSSLTPDNAGGHPQFGQMGMIGGAVIPFITGGLSGVGADQLREHGAIREIAGSGLNPDDKFRLGILDNVRFIPVKAFLLAFPAKVSVRVRRVPVHVVVVVIAVSLLFFQAKKIHLGSHIGGVNDMQPVRDQTLPPGLVHHPVEPPLKAIGPQTPAKTAQGSVAGRQLFAAQPQEPLENQGPGALFFDFPVREVIEKLQKDHFEHGHRVPGVPAPVHVKVTAGFSDKAKVYRPAQLMEKMGALPQQVVIDEVAEERTVGRPFFMRPSGNIIFLILQYVNQIHDPKKTYF